MNEPQPAMWVQSEFTVRSADGLHARPVIKLSRLARRFSSAIQIRLAGEQDWVDAKSVSKLMSLKVQGGKTVEARASGDDAAGAIAGLGEFFEDDLDEQNEGAG
ncbi:MAG TPA: HPr family phosphocarrier protein [Sphingomonadaceae bacterium]